MGHVKSHLAVSKSAEGVRVDGPVAVTLKMFGELVAYSNLPPA